MQLPDRTSGSFVSSELCCISNESLARYSLGSGQKKKIKEDGPREYLIDLSALGGM